MNRSFSRVGRYRNTVMTSDLPSIPTDSEIAGERDNVRHAVLAAMQRILTGNPRVVPPGSDSILQLAAEAGIGRHQLYRSAADLRLRFERIKDASNRQTDGETLLQRRLDDAKEEVRRLALLQAQTRREGEQWKGLVELLHRAINVLQEELRTEQIRAGRLEKRLQQEAERNPGAPVVPIRPRIR